MYFVRQESSAFSDVSWRPHYSMRTETPSSFRLGTWGLLLTSQLLLLLAGAVSGLPDHPGPCLTLLRRRKCTGLGDALGRQRGHMPTLHHPGRIQFLWRQTIINGPALAARLHTRPFPARCSVSDLGLQHNSLAEACS